MPVTPNQTFTEQARRKPIFFWVAVLLGVVMLAWYLFGGVMIARYGTVTRDSNQLRLELRPERRHNSRVLGVLLSNLAASLGFYVVGLMLGLLKPEDRLTRRASLTLLAWASYTLYISLEQAGQLFTFWERV